MRVKVAYKTLIVADDGKVLISGMVGEEGDTKRPYVQVALERDAAIGRIGINEALALYEIFTLGEEVLTSGKYGLMIERDTENNVYTLLFLNGEGRISLYRKEMIILLKAIEAIGAALVCAVTRV
jgi:hypothetical protein